MADLTVMTNVIFLLIVPLIYLLVSTLHIYCPSGASSSAIDNVSTHDYEPPTDHEFLLRLGSLHVYGIRAVFIAEIVCGSVLFAATIAYVAFAHRKTVKRDGRKDMLDAGKRGQLEQKFEGGQREQWGDRRNTWDTEATFARNSIASRGKKRANKGGRRNSVLPSFVTLSASLSSTRPSSTASRVAVARSRSIAVLRPQRRGVQQARQAVSFLRGKTRQRTKNMRELERLGGMHLSSSGGESFEGLVGDLPSGMTLCHDLPSWCYSRHSPTEGRPLNEREGCAASSAIPSYYFKEHDAEGRSIIELAEGHSSPEMKVVKNELVRMPGVVMQTIDKEDAALSTINSYANNVQLTATNAGSDLVSQGSTVGSAVTEASGGRRRTALSRNTVISASSGAGDADEARRPEGEDTGWEAVYCSGWRDVRST